MKNRKTNQKLQSPILRFSPTAWAKLLYFRDRTDNEVGGFGITEADDLLFVTDFVLVKQKVTVASVAFEDESVADHFENQVEAGRKPEQFGRIWLHTHPGNSPEPSCTDENTFARVFGNCDWAVMCIVAQDSKTFARLRFNAGPGGAINIPVCVDYSSQFKSTDFVAWKKQYIDNVAEDTILTLNRKSKKSKTDEEDDFFGSQELCAASQSSQQDLLAEIDALDPMDREIFLEELADRSGFWDESEVFYE